MDVQIDKVNKPYLPIAAGYFSMTTALVISIISGIVGIFSAYLAGPIFLKTIAFAGLVTSMYSLPPFMLKYNGAIAALAIGVTRGVVGNLGLYLHFRTTLGGEAYVPLKLMSLAFFYFIFGLIIGIMKDIPDMKGDAKSGVKSFALKYGAPKMLRFATGLLTFNYVVLFITTIFSYTEI
jgi:homogentisate phytyltransferase/homogentisate geranylgeranyltransferase